MTALLAIGEAIALGLASGPACVASCGPVLVPPLLAQGTGVRTHAGYLSAFLGTRFAGYLLFAAVAWQAGSIASVSPERKSLVFGIVHVLLAGALAWYAWPARQPRPRAQAAASSELVTIGAARRRGLPGAAALGFLTGVSLCPPFVAAGVRAAELGSLAAALLFFTAFFVGTSAWFVPFLGMGCIRRNEAVFTVARMTMALIAVYYLYVGLMMLLGSKVYGY